MTGWHAFPVALADRCVMCAQCLPHCPTWRLARVEAESPRGRIALMRGLASGALVADRAVLRHLDQCLDCRRCEAVCPAEVPYGALHDATQLALGGPRRHQGLLARCLRAWVRRPAAFGGVMGALIRAWAGSRLRHILAPLLPGRLRGLERLLPEHAPRPPRAGVHGEGERVFLFMGCIARAVDSGTLAAAVTALNRLGFSVEVPATQGCCGALQQHSGDPEGAVTLAGRNLRAFAGDAPVITCASGCAATLLDYPGMLGDDGAKFAARVVDIMTFIAARGASPARTTTGTVLHTPCTLHAVQHAAAAPAALLEGARALDHKGSCCGAAGEYLLAQPELSRRLRDAVLDGLGETATLCTSNPGCAMHLRAGLRERGHAASVHHPVIEWLRCR